MDINKKNNIFMNKYDEISYLVEGEDFKEFEHLNEILSCRREINLNETEFNICYGYILMNILESIKDRGFIFYKLLFNIINDLKNNIPNNLDILRVLIWYNETYLKNDGFKTKIKSFLLKIKKILIMMKL